MSKRTRQEEDEDPFCRKTRLRKVRQQVTDEDTLNELKEKAAESSKTKNVASSKDSALTDVVSLVIVF